MPVVHAAFDVRTRIVLAATKLLAHGDREALTTRAVAAAARVQAPAIYRLFGDKRGLLDAVVAHGIASYVREKSDRAPLGDPIEDLRAGWDLHIEFGVTNPAIYALMADPSLQLPSAAGGREVLEQRVHRIALAGRLRVSVARAVDLIHATGVGTVLALLEREPSERDLSLSVDAREAVIAAITTKAPVGKTSKAVTAAITLRASLDELTPLSARERDLLDEWLAKIAG